MSSTAKYFLYITCVYILIYTSQSTILVRNENLRSTYRYECDDKDNSKIDKDNYIERNGRIEGENQKINNDISNNKEFHSNMIFEGQRTSQKRQNEKPISSMKNSKPTKSSYENFSSSYEKMQNTCSNKCSHPRSSTSCIIEEEWPSSTTLTEHPSIPLLPHFVGVEGNSIASASKFNVVKTVTEISTNIAIDISSSGSLNQRNTMSKFIRLTQLVETMNVKQMKMVVNLLYANRKQIDHKNSKDIIKVITWEVYVHAIGVAGTGSALETIKSLIENGQIYGQEAAQIVSNLPKAAKVPSAQYMDLFFSILKSDVVQKQQHLNSTAALAFAELLRISHMNKASSRIRYAQHIIGRLACNKNINEKYLGFLEQKLNNAITNNDDHGAHVYIKSLGRTGHPRLLMAFEDYLEGKKRCSHFQRFLMVRSLYHVTTINSRLVEPVLLKLYENHEEKEEIRTAAVNLIMTTNPSAEMLQRLAMATYNEPSRSVKSAIISGIETAAADHALSNDELTRNAQAAKGFLKPKDYGLTSSKTFIFSILADEVDAKYENMFNYIIGKDHFYPQNLFWSTQQYIRGIFKDKKHVEVMTSSVNELLKKLSGQFVHMSRNNHYNSGERYSSAEIKRNSWSADKIAKMLGIKIPNSPDVEATLVYELFGGKRIIALGNSSINSLPQMMMEMYQEIKASPHLGFTTFYNDDLIQLGFATPMGLPFFYCGSRPVMFHINGETTIKTQPDVSGGSHEFIKIPQHLNISLDFEARYIIHSESKLGFVAPFNHHEYFSGVSKKVEMNIGLKLGIGLDNEKNELDIDISAYNKDRKQIIFDYETIPFTTKHNLLSIEPALNQGGTERIHINKQVKATYEFGKKSTGIALRYDTMSERISTDSNFFDFNLVNLNTLKFPLFLKGIHPNQVRLTYDPHESTADSVKISMAYKRSHDYLRNGSQSEVPKTSNNFQSIPKFQEAKQVVAEGDKRKKQNEFLSRVSAGVPEADTYLIDISADFKQAGQLSKQIIILFAISSSDISPVTKTLFYYVLNPLFRGKTSSGKSFEVCGSTTGYFPTTPEINVYDALNTNSNSTLLLSIAFGDDCKSGYRLDAKAVFSQSSMYRENFIQRSMVKLCKEGRAMSYSCQNVVRQANEIDNIKLYFNWESFEKDFSSEDNKLHESARSRSSTSGSTLFSPLDVFLNRFGISYLYYSKYLQRATNSKNEVEIEAQYSSDHNYVNITLLRGQEEIKFMRARLAANLRVKPIQFTHWLINAPRYPMESILNFPSCSLSRNSIKTFDNAIYSMRFGKYWHTVFLHTPKRINPAKYLGDRESDVHYESEWQNVVVLAKEAGNGKELQMILGDSIVELKPSKHSEDNSTSSKSETKKRPAAQVTINGQLASFSSERSAGVKFNDNEYLVKVFAKPNGEVTVKSQRYGVIVKYFLHDVDIFAAGFYKDNVRGLCGTYDGNKYNDFTTPRNCVVKEKDLFAASYALYENESSSSLKEIQRAAAHVDCYKETFQYVDVIGKTGTGFSTPCSKNIVQPKYEIFVTHSKSDNKTPDTSNSKTPVLARYEITGAHPKAVPEMYYLGLPGRMTVPPKSSTPTAPATATTSTISSTVTTSSTTAPP